MASKRRGAALTGSQRRYLRSLAHRLKPVVQIGTSGVTDGVVAEVDRALETHELIKIRVSDDSPIDREHAGKMLASKTHSELAQIIGKIVVLYRRHPKTPKIELPRTSKSA